VPIPRSWELDCEAARAQARRAGSLARALEAALLTGDLTACAVVWEFSADRFASINWLNGLLHRIIQACCIN
jgi:hypothetical protein